MILNALVLFAVVVNPEAKRHVRIAHQVKDSTTRDVGVLVAQTVGKLNKRNTKNRRHLNVSDSVRGTVEDAEEHEANCECVSE